MLNEFIFALAILGGAVSAAQASPRGGPAECTDIASVQPFTQFNYEKQFQAIWDAFPDPKDPDPPSGQCTRCHRTSTGAGGLGLGAAFSHRNLVGVASGQDPSLTRVIPGNAFGSLLFQKVNCDVPGIGFRMPPGSPLSVTQQALIYYWINAGAPMSKLGFEDR